MKADHELRGPTIGVTRHCVRRRFPEVTYLWLNDDWYRNLSGIGTVFPNLRALIVTTSSGVHDFEIAGCAALHATLTHLELSFGEQSWYGGLARKNESGHGPYSIDVIAQLRQLRKLAITGIRSGTAAEFKALERLPCTLETLHMESENELENMGLDTHYDPSKHLDCLVDLSHLQQLRALTLGGASLCTRDELNIIALGQAQAILLPRSLQKMEIGSPGREYLPTGSCTTPFKAELKRMGLTRLVVHEIGRPQTADEWAAEKAARAAEIAEWEQAEAERLEEQAESERAYKRQRIREVGEMRCACCKETKCKDRIVSYSYPPL